MCEAQTSGPSKPTLAAMARENSFVLKDNEWILVVEDSETDTILLKLALGNCAAKGQLKCLADGEQAITTLSRLATANPEELPDTIVLDLNLPRIDGYTILAHIRSNSSLQGIAVFVYTSSESEVDRRRVLAGGADGFCTKPNDLAGYRRLPEAIQQARGRRADRLNAMHH